MNVLVFHPELGMGIVDTKYQFTPASKADPATYASLLAKGTVLSDVTVWQGYAFHGEPALNFWIVSDTDIPEGLPVKSEKVSDKIYKCVTWTDSVISYLQKTYADWKVTRDEPIVHIEIAMPEECMGETWATTDESVLLSQVTDDCYCIENNWEQRGSYWIIDCPARNKRLVHSDNLQFNEEYELG